MEKIQPVKEEKDVVHIPDDLVSILGARARKALSLDDIDVAAETEIISETTRD